MDDILYDDEYDGERWTYGMTYRPLGFANVPDGWIVFSNKKHPDFYFGTIDYPFELPERAVKSFQLTHIE